MTIKNLNNRLLYLGLILLVVVSMAPLAVNTLQAARILASYNGKLNDDGGGNGNTNSSNYNNYFNNNNKVLTTKTIATSTITTAAATTKTKAPDSSAASAGNNAPTATTAISKRIKSAFVKPVFTAAAYNSSFYLFYAYHKHDQPNTNVTKDINLLYSHLTSKTYSYPFAMLGLVSDARKALPNSDIQVISDVDVDKGKIFENSSNNNNKENNNNNTKINNAYDLLVLGHQEYVTQREYNNLKQFVANGGTIIFLDGNMFMAEVEYNQYTDTIRLVKGHGWAFNGMSAWKSVWQRWDVETTQWVGSSYFSYSHNIHFQNNPFGYTPHEEQYITNPKDRIILDYNATLVHPADFANKRIPQHFTIATYELQYQKGKVIVIGLYADDLRRNKAWHAYFQSLLTQDHIIVN